MSVAEEVTVTTLMENYLDFLLPSVENVRRVGMEFQFDPKHDSLLAENGLSLLVEVSSGSAGSTILLDAGFRSSKTLLHNMAVLGVDAGRIDHILISHGHPDHCGSLMELLRAVGKPTPVYVHPDAFYPRYLHLPTGASLGPYNYMLLQRARLEDAGALLVEARSPVPLGPGVQSSGEVERTVDFEARTPPTQPSARLLRLRDGILEEDPVLDDQALYIHLKDKGLIVLTGCAHAGIVNAVKHGLKVTGAKRVHAVVGGMHLGFPGVPTRKVDRTVAALKEFNPSLISPMHCTGFKAMAKFYREMEEAFVLNTVGTKLTFT